MPEPTVGNPSLPTNTEPVVGVDRFVGGKQGWVLNKPNLRSKHAPGPHKSCAYVLPNLTSSLHRVRTNKGADQGGKFCCVMTSQLSSADHNHTDCVDQ
jgi:hypothetical protein